MNQLQSAMNAMNNSATHMLPPGMSFDCRGNADVTASTKQSTSTQSQSLSSPISSQFSASLEREARARNAAYALHMARQGSASTNADMATNYQPQFPQLPSFSSGGVPWPAWQTDSVLSPFDIPPPRNDQALANAAAEHERQGQLATGNGITITGENNSLRLGESKKTGQRRVQRQRRNEYKEKSMVWPMRIACSEKGELPKDVRLFVHAQFRATARKFLNFSVIHFRDHPGSDIKVVKEDLDRRFSFDPPLREDYILGYIEVSMRTSRYLWRKFWVNSGKGSKHKFCPARYFPALVSYWKTAAAEEESKRMKEARNAAKKKKAERLAARQDVTEESEDLWDVSVLAFRGLYGNRLRSEASRHSKHMRS